MKDEYYSRPEVSNSDLTKMKMLLNPSCVLNDPTNAFRMGSLVDALVTEPDKANHISKTVDDYTYTDDEWNWGKKMREAFNKACRDNVFLGFVKENSTCQEVMVNHGQQFEYDGLNFTLDTRCKWDFWMPQALFGGDLKTTSATTQEQFEQSIDTFDWDRSRAWYMDIAHTDMDFIVAISKVNQKIFFKTIKRGDEIYERGKEKYSYLAFQYWATHYGKV